MLVTSVLECGHFSTKLFYCGVRVISPQNLRFLQFPENRRHMTDGQGAVLNVRLISCASKVLMYFWLCRYNVKLFDERFVNLVAFLYKAFCCIEDETSNMCSKHVDTW